MKRIVAMIIALFSSLISVNGFAQATSPEQFHIVLVRPNKGLLDAMTYDRRHHCHPSQLTAVMKDNGLSWSDLLHLQPGQQIRLSSQCSTVAAPEVAVQSTAIVVSENNRMSTVAAKAMQNLQDEIAALKSALANALSTIAELKNQNDALNGKLPTIMFQASPAQKASLFCSGFLIASLGWAAYIFVFRKQPITQEEFPEEIVYNNHGRVRTFQKVSGPMYRCECGEKNLQAHNIPRHCSRHVEDTFEEGETVVLEPQSQMV